MRLTPDLLWMIALAAMLACAVWSDVKSRRIPNIVTGAGLVVALALAAAPEGVGLASSAGGMLTGFALLMPLYLVRAGGAGDVKLFAAVGAFVGFPAIAGVAIATFIAGGLLSIALASRLRILGPVLRNLRDAACVAAAEVSAGRVPDMRAGDESPRMPYALAIAAGVLVHAAASHSLLRGFL